MAALLEKMDQRNEQLQLLTRQQAERVDEHEETDEYIDAIKGDLDSVKRIMDGRMIEQELCENCKLATPTSPSCSTSAHGASSCAVRCCCWCGSERGNGRRRVYGGWRCSGTEAAEGTWDWGGTDHR